ncbi:hypothetical protein BV113_00480 [Glutamicibacter phage BIM BV-113]|nr:hypothetical protein BV113_00480 [Glutamicibacter phage BIM BV-113]
MAKLFSGTVSQEQVIAAVEALGLKPENVFSVNITGERVRVIEFKRDVDGNRIFNAALQTYEKRSYTLQVK